MESNKYYQPKIEEFYVGFEYEIQDIETAQFGTCIFKDGESVENLLNGDYGEVCVKYLNREDIEEVLNTKQLKGSDVELNFQLIINDKLFYEVDYDTEDKKLVVEKWVGVFENTSNCYTLFKGKVVNKSELKKIMQMLNIID